MNWTTALALAAFGAASLYATQEQPVFRAGVEVVEVDVIATTENGESVGDLRRDELQVFEDGLRKEIVGSRSDVERLVICQPSPM